MLGGDPPWFLSAERKGRGRPGDEQAAARVVPPFWGHPPLGRTCSTLNAHQPSSRQHIPSLPFLDLASLSLPSMSHSLPYPAQHDPRMVHPQLALRDSLPQGGLLTPDFMASLGSTQPSVSPTSRTAQVSISSLRFSVTFALVDGSLSVQARRRGRSFR